MNSTSYNKALRCACVVLNESGLHVANRLFSNIFDIDYEYVNRDLRRYRRAYSEWRKNGGSIKEWENEQNWVHHSEHGEKVDGTRD